MATDQRSIRLIAEAIVTDVEWIGKSVRAFGFMAPGEVKVFPPAELGAAKVWVAE